MANEPYEGAKEVRGRFVSSIGEDSETLRRGLSDERLQNAFIEAIDDDPQLVEVLAKVTPNIGDVAAGWSCCRGNRPALDLFDYAQSMKNRIESSKKGGGG